MKKNQLITAAGMLLLILSACGKTEMTPVSGERGTIRFAVPLQTRATVNANEESVFQVRDWHDDSYYINNTLLFDNQSSSWVYGTTAEYEWIPGQHLFFGWLQRDSRYYSVQNFFGPDGVNSSGTMLTLSAKTLDNATQQYDFLYSDAVRRSSGGSDPVQLTFRHLFSRVSILFKVTGDDDEITLQKVYLASAKEADEEDAAYVPGAKPFKNSKGPVEINFAGANGVSVDYGTGASEGYFAAPADFSSVDEGAYSKSSIPVDVLRQRQDYNAVSLLVWPMSELELEDVIIVEYLVGSQLHKAHLSFPAGTSWEAGHEYHYMVTYMGGFIKIQETITPWVAPEVVTVGGNSPEQPVMASWLGWDSRSCEVSGKDRTVATFKNEADVNDDDGDNDMAELKPVLGRFQIYSPVECTWHIELTGAPGMDPDEYFQVTPSSGTISETEGDGVNLPGTTILFSVSALQQSSSPVTAGMTFSVTANGRSYSLDSEIQKDGAFQITIPETTTQSSGD